MLLKVASTIIRRNYKAGIYEAKFTAEDSVRILELFGTDTLPTPYLLSARAESVRQAIWELNKYTIVTLEL